VAPSRGACIDHPNDSDVDALVKLLDRSTPTNQLSPRTLREMVPDTDPGDGPCRICDATYTYNGITRHLRRCVAEQAGDDAPSWIHLRFKSFTTASKPHWLHLLANPEAPLRRLDDHLREVWYFGTTVSTRLAISTETHSRRPNPEDPSDEAVDEMTEPMSEILEPNPEFNYFYAPQRSRLMLLGKVYSEGLPPPKTFRKTSPEADVHTLARNESIHTSCDNCEAPDANYRCFDCFVPRWICQNCRTDHPDDHRLYEHKNTPLMRILG